MKLKELYPNTHSDIEITGIKLNSKDCVEGDLFVCTMGVVADRHDFIDDAIKNGARAVVVSREVGKKDVPIIKVEDTNKELQEVCSKFYNYPYRELFMIGVTGTTGKTTVSELIYQILGDNCAYLGTNGKKYKNKSESIRNTTPDVDRLYKYMREFVDGGCINLCMEASSEAFYRNRLNQISYDIGILTNIEEDHLNIHKTLDNYVDCKCQLFKQVKKDGFCILNSSSKYLDRVKLSCSGKILTYGFNKEDDLYIKDYSVLGNTTEINFIYNNHLYTVYSPLLGSFNVLNVACAILVCLVKGMDINTISLRVKQLKQIEGRMEVLPFTDKYLILLDYAHTPDALLQVLEYLNSIKKRKIITVTGSAGGREKEKRPLMGKVVLENSDLVIFTMDDPRNEDVNDIIDDLIGSSTNTNYIKVPDRNEAIKKALSMAKEDDIIFIAGKGRDNYMAIKDEYLPYCDYDVVKEYFNY